MRTYKFRGKTVETGKWIYGYYFFSTTHEIIDIDTGLRAVVRKETVGQYVRDDEKGNEVYEGDKVKYIWHPEVGNPDREGVVRWECEFQKGTYVIDEKDSPQYWTFNSIERLEVIGNIHEEPK